MRCPKCGSEEAGRFCSQCGTAVTAREGGGKCRKCGTGLEPDAMYCGECGTPTGFRQPKPARAFLPWILSGLALVAFAVALTLFIQGQASVRLEGMPPTGGLPGADGSVDGGAAAGAPAGPAGVDLGSMTPKQAADRLFDRAMRVDESGSEAEGRQFASMAVQAYGMVQPAEIDADVRFHLGLLHLVLDDPDSAEREADMILSLEREHLLALSIKARVGEARGDETARARAYERFLDALPAELTSGKVEYQTHDGLLERESVRAREITGRE
jgi:hypothetical protein